MRHRKAGVKLGRTGSHRNAMFRNMVTSLLQHDRIQTTDTKAKELRRWVDHIITLAKRGDLHARRQALAIVRDKAVVHKLFDSAQELFGNRAGGYSRLIKLGRRAGDAAPMTMVELIVPEDKAADRKKKQDKAAKKEAPVAAEAAASADVTALSDKQAEAQDAADKPAEPTASSETAGTEEGTKES
jgi:large subunit ribosomal protein L17